MLISNLSGRPLILSLLPLASGLLHLFVGHKEPDSFVTDHEAQAVAPREVSLKASTKDACGCSVGEILLNRRVKITVRVGAAGAQAEHITAVKITSTKVAVQRAKAASAENGGAVSASRGVTLANCFDHATQLATELCGNT